MRGKIAQLAGFIDQARLFLPNRAVTNKLHFIAPSGFSCTWDASWNSGPGNSTADWPSRTHCCCPHPESLTEKAVSDFSRL
jgi:hypothetical protein